MRAGFAAPAARAVSHAFPTAQTDPPLSSALAPALDPAEPEPSVPPPAEPPAIRHERRWSADGWLMLRGGGDGSLAAGSGAPATYGASQAGAVLRYRLAPRQPPSPGGVPTRHRRAQWIGRKGSGAGPVPPGRSPRCRLSPGWRCAPRIAPADCACARRCCSSANCRCLPCQPRYRPKPMSRPAMSADASPRRIAQWPGPAGWRSRSRGRTTLALGAAAWGGARKVWRGSIWGLRRKSPCTLARRRRADRGGLAAARGGRRRGAIVRPGAYTVGRFLSAGLFSGGGWSRRESQRWMCPFP